MLDEFLSMLTGYKKTCAFFAAIKLGLFNELRKGRYTLIELSDDLKVDPEVLYLLLVYFQGEGFLECLDGTWGQSKEFSLLEKKFDELSPIINHEENIYRNWVTTDSIVMAVKAGMGGRPFDQEGFEHNSLNIYNKAMYGKNVDVISFWMRREIRNICDSSFLEYGRSPGVLTASLKKHGSKFDADVAVFDEFYNITQEYLVDQEISVYRCSELKNKKKYDVVTMFNTVHYYSNIDLRNILTDLSKKLKADSVLCIVDIFYCEGNQFLKNLLLDWITHGGIHFIYIDEVTALLNEVGFTDIKVKKIKDINIDIMFCSVKQLEERG